MEGVRFDHVAHAARSIRDLMPLYADQLGGRPLSWGSNERFGYRGVMLGYSDGSRIELLDPTPNSDFLDSFFSHNPRGGLHHLTFRTDDIERAMVGCRKAGFELVGEYLDDPDWLEVFVHPRSAHGTVVQLLQAPPMPPGPQSPGAPTSLVEFLG